MVQVIFEAIIFDTTSIEHCGARGWRRRITDPGLWLSLFIIIALGGCAIRTLPESPGGATVEEPTVSRPQPPASRPAVYALDRMLTECRAQVEARQWQAAIASAERGLRINRREPELYLLLAKSYRGLTELDRARQFARQGLRYVSNPFSAIASDLNSLLAALDEGERPL